jgi:hypothetical protein
MKKLSEFQKEEIRNWCIGKTKSEKYAYINGIYLIDFPLSQEAEGLIFYTSNPEEEENV